MKAKKLNIRSTKHLSLRLGIPEEEITRVSSIANRLYGRREEPKKNGKIRIINPPKPELKIIQKRINAVLNTVDLPDNIHSYRKDRSIKTNAIPHVGNDWLIKADITDFYPHITNKMVYELFISLGCTSKISRACTKTVEEKNQ